MQQPDVTQMLRERFERPLERDAVRRIVFWHDAEGSFEETFDGIANAGLGTSRPVSFAKVEEGGFFALKRRVYREERERDFLLYTAAPKDLSPRGLEGNWLADVELLAEHFQADYASMLADELGADEAASPSLRRYSAFFRAAPRRTRFRALVPHARSEVDVTLGVIGSVLGARDLTTESLLRTYLCALEEGQHPLDELERFGAANAFTRFVELRLGYTGDVSDTDDLAAHLLLTALSAQLPQGALDGLQGRMSPAHGQLCLNVVRAWMDAEGDAATLYGLARRTETLCNLPARLSDMAVRDLADADVFPCINECLLTGLFSSMSAGADRADEAAELVRRRRNLRWFKRVGTRFDALDAAARMQRFYRDYASEGFHYTRPADAWEAYTGDWYCMDTAYRDFCRAVDASGLSVSDVPEGMKDALELLATRMEDLYTDWFLWEANTCWVRCCEKEWGQAGYVGGIPYQERFFGERVRAGQGKAKKTLVVISDALRYEVALSLAQRLERDTQGTTKVSSMQGVFPSITEFGMAALLPHHVMGYSADDDAVFLDGNVPTVTTAQREVALRRAEPSAVCLQSKDLMRVRRAERRSMVGEASVVYVYHNQIDATGEASATENKVFNACDEAIDDIVALVRIATSDLQFSRVLVTADHGFLYTRNPLKEDEKVSATEVRGRVVLHKRRCLVCDQLEDVPAPFVRIDMGRLADGCVGLAPRGCVRIKKAGPGENYVHGGVSLQELCVPVVELRQRRSGQRSFEEREKAGVRLLSADHRVSSMLFAVDLFQEKAVGGKVLPAEYELVVTDASGNKVSDVRRVHADMTDADDARRVSRVQLALKAGIAYSPRDVYRLSCVDASTKAVVWREELQIDIPFAPLDDFGF